MVTVKGNQPDWKEYSFEFSSGEKNSAHLRFLVDSQADSILIDDVRLEKAPSAPTAEMTASLLAFGARPDGSEDAAPAFRKAVEAGAKTILIPAGTFAVGELALPDSISLRGVGEESRLIPFGEKPKFVIRGGSNAMFSDFSVDLGGKKVQALFFLRARNVTVSGVFIRNSTAFGINFDHVDNALIENCVIRDTHTGIMQTYCSNVRTMRNTVTGSIKHGIQFWSQDHWRPEARTRNLWFCDNYVKNSPTGDGGILADELLDTLPEKRYDIGIVPHVCDLNDPAAAELVRRYDNAKLINVKDDPITVLTQIAQCRCVLSSSLHGLIAADSFHIPNLHIIFSDRPLGDGYKFDDYYSAYDVPHRPWDLRVNAAPTLSEAADGWRMRPEQVEEKKRQMRAAFPYPAVNGGSL